MPVCPSEYRPGWGHTHSPCGSDPTVILEIRWPSVVSIAYTTPLYRPDSQSTRPSADRPPMSGLPPPGIFHFVTRVLVAKSSREIEPSPRLVMYRCFESRLTYRPCAP